MARLLIVSVMFLFSGAAFAFGNFGNEVQEEDTIAYEVPEPHKLDKMPPPTSAWMVNETQELNFGPYCIQNGATCEPGGKKKCCDESKTCQGQFPNFTCQ